MLVQGNFKNYSTVHLQSQNRNFFLCDDAQPIPFTFELTSERANKKQVCTNGAISMEIDTIMTSQATSCIC